MRGKLEPKSEREILKHCMLAASECGAYVFRNNRGFFWTLDKQRRVKAGLSAPGSSDLIGWTRDGKFLAIEVKTLKGVVSDDQKRFIDLVNNSGGVGFVARSAQDVRDRLCENNIADMQK